MLIKNHHQNLFWPVIFAISAALFISQFDASIILYLSENQTYFLPSFWRLVTELGNGTIYFTACFWGLIVGYWGQLHSPIIARKLFEFSFVSLASLVSAGLVIRLLKWMIGRPRPKVWLEENIADLSPFSFMSEFNAFPSGHTQTAFTVAFLLSLLAPKYRCQFLCAAGLIGLSRVTLLNHWPSDVIVGALIGIAVPMIVMPHMKRFFDGSGERLFRPHRYFARYKLSSAF